MNCSGVAASFARRPENHFGVDLPRPECCAVAIPAPGYWAPEPARAPVEPSRLIRTMST